MKVLIVHAHPEPQSFCSALCTAALQALQAQGHEVQVSDLYAMGFNPVASAADFSQRQNPDYLNYALEQRHAQAAGTLAPDIQTELDKLMACDLLILNFPVFWCSTPAMLKGWIDRVLVSGRVYGGKRFYDRGGLRGKRALLSMTIGAQAHMLAPDGIHGPLNDMLRHLLRGTLAYAGLTVLPPHVAWHVPYVSTEARAAMLDHYRQLLADIDMLAPLVFPRLDDFDAELRPLPGGREGPSDAPAMDRVPSPAR